MRCPATLLLFSLAAVSLALASPLRDQLALAETAEDRHAQIELIRRILDEEPDDALREKLVTLWLAVPDYDMAAAALADWKTAPESFRTRVEAEVLFHRDDNRDKAIALLAAFHAAQPDDLDITRQLARYQGDMANPQAVVELLTAAPGVADDAPLLLQRAAARRVLADYDGALADFALATRVDGKMAANEQPAYDRLKNALPHIKAATEVLEAEPTNFAALVRRAYWLQAIGARPERVRQDAQAAHQQAPAAVTALWLVARSTGAAPRALREWSVDLSQPDPAPENFERLLKLDEALQKKPTDPATLTLRSYELNDTPAQYRLAVQDADAALATDPARADARLEKIFALLKLNRFPDAAAEVRVLEQKKTAADKLSRAYIYLADADLRAYRMESALDHANKALKARSSADAYKFRAVVLQRMGRAAEAAEDLAAAAKLSNTR